MKFDLDGKTYEFTGDRLSIGEAREVKRHLGVTLAQFDLDLKLWERGIGIPDGDTFAGVVWIAMRRAGEEPDLAVIDRIDIGQLGESVAAHKKADDGEPSESESESGPAGPQVAEPVVDEEDAGTPRSA